MSSIPETKTIFIVEDNAIYARMLGDYLTTKFPDINEVKIFPFEEAGSMVLYQNPSVIILDHLQNSVQGNANTGLSIIKQIKTTKPDANVILLSSQTQFDIDSKIILNYGCKYVKKDSHAFRKVEQLVSGCFLTNPK